jgi:hypothetical protein
MFALTFDVGFDEVGGDQPRGAECQRDTEFQR